MPTQDKPSHSPWIVGINNGKSYKLRFIDYGKTHLDLELDLYGQSSVIIPNIPRDNSIRYQNTHSDDYVENEIYNYLEG